MNADTDRERGVLSPADRAFLLGERDLEHPQSRRNARARIRQRVHDAMLDFDLLLHTLSNDDRQQIFDEVHTDEAFLDALRAMLAFTYVGTAEQGMAFEEVLLPAVRSSEGAMAAKTQGENVDVEVTFEVETTPVNSLEGVAARLETGSPVTPRELFSLIMEGSHDPAQYDEITLLTGDPGVGSQPGDEQFLERLASYLDADLEVESETRAVLYP